MKRQSQGNRRERTKIFPPIIPAAALLGAWGLEKLIPFFNFGFGIRVTGWALAIIGLALMVWAIIHQYRRGTDPNPFGKTSALVTDGPYRFSRNPIYLADLVVQVGLALALNLEWGIVLLPATWAGLRWLVIRHEEKFLGEQFAAEYHAYFSRVRRWL